MASNPLLTLNGVRFRTEQGSEVGPLDWEILQGERIALEGAKPDGLEALANLLCGVIQPTGGLIVERKPVKAQTDRKIKESLSMNRTISEYLAASDMPEFVWLDRRRRSLFVLVDKLGLLPNHMRRPLKFLAGEVVDKFWALRFIISNADLMIAFEIFALQDPLIREAIAMRWQDFPGSLIAMAPPALLPEPPHRHMTLTEEGDLVQMGS